MMHVRGPDDINSKAPDYETAVSWCDYVNDVLAKAALRSHDEGSPGDLDALAARARRLSARSDQRLDRLAAPTGAK